MSLAWILWRNWFFKGLKIYSNIHLFKIPYYFISGINQLNEIKPTDMGNDARYIGMDELWLYVDSRMSRTKKNIFVANILAKSRKRELTYISTTQVADSVEGRIRKILDFTFYPMLNREETIMKVLIFRTGYIKSQHFMKVMYYKTELAKLLYDTMEEIDVQEESTEKMIPTFQENFNRSHGYNCECSECGTKFFPDWNSCEKFASDWYAKNVAKIKPMIM